MTDKTAPEAVEKPRQSRGRGRPTSYTPEMAAKLCAMLADGQSLRSICKGNEFPEKSTILLWVVDGEHQEFSDQYRRAREAAGYAHADRIIDTVDRVSDGEIDHQSAKAMLDGLKWAAERMSPKAHSPRMQQEHTSPDGSMTPQPTRVELVAPHDDGEDRAAT